MSNANELLEEHQALFGAQMGNWDKLRDKAIKMDGITFSVFLTMIILAMAVFKEAPAAAGLIVLVAFFGVPLAEHGAFWFIEQSHKRIDRRLEAQKEDIVARIDKITEEEPNKAPLGVWSVHCKFAPPKRRRRFSWYYYPHSPWEDFEYTYYW